MSPEDQTTERLNAAIDALIRGTPLAEACADLPRELHPLATAGARLAALRVAAPDGPRPGFVLSLEEQLRADLRLGQGAGPSDPPAAGPRPTPNQPPPAGPLPNPAETPLAPLSQWAARTWLVRGVVIGLVMAGLLGLYRGAERAGPTDTLYPAKRAIEAIRLFAAFSAEDKAQVCLDVGWRRLEEASQALRSGRTADLADMVEDMTTAYTLALTFAERSDDRRMANLAQSETELAVGELGRLAAQADPREAALLRNVNLVLSGTGKGRKIVAVTAPSATATAGPTQVVAVPPISPPLASPTAEPGDPPGAPSAEPTAPPAVSPSPELPPGPNPSATPPATAQPPASPTLAPTAPPTTTVPPPPAATRIKPKPQPPTATRTAAPPSDPTRTPKPWATEPPPSPTEPPPRPSATPSEPEPPATEPPPTEAPSVEPPTAAPPPGPGQP